MDSAEDKSITFLAGDRIVLSPIRTEDSHLYERWLNDAEVSSTLVLHYPLTHEAELKFLDQLVNMPIEKGFVLGIRLKGTMALIGGIGIHDISSRDRHAEVGLFIGEKNLWGKGYAKEAMQLVLSYVFDTLNLRKVWLCHYDHNTRGSKLYLSLGFKEVGRRREHRFIDGKWRDEILMEIFRRDFER